MLSAEERGAGPPIVLVHGFGAGGAIWRRQLEELSDEFRVLAPDLPGFGASPPLAKADAAGFAASLAQYLDAKRLEDVLLVGWSMGGVVVLAYCEQLGSHRLAGIGIVDVAPRVRPAPDWPTADFSRQVDAWVERWPANRESVVRELAELAFAEPEQFRPEIDWLVVEALRADPSAALEAFTALLECDFRNTLPQIDVPALVLYGGRSRSTSLELANYMQSRLRHPHLVIFEGCGHALMLEAPEAFAAAVRDFHRSLLDAP